MPSEKLSGGSREIFLLREYEHKMKGVLWVWGRCAYGRFSGYPPSEEDQHWDEYPSQFLRLYKKASQTLGFAYGGPTVRLAEEVEAAGAVASSGEAPPDDKPPAPKKPDEDAHEVVWWHSDDYRKITYNGESFCLTENQGDDSAYLGPS